MSLSRWLVDYVFIPLGGSRTAQPRVYLNVLITMFLSGLWHGAGLNFVVWGLWHGMLLMIHRVWKQWRERRVLPPSIMNPRAPDQSAAFVTVTLRLVGFFAVIWVRALSF